MTNGLEGSKLFTIEQSLSINVVSVVLENNAKTSSFKIHIKNILFCILSPLFSLQTFLHSTDMNHV